MRPAGELRQALRNAAPPMPADRGLPVTGASYLGLAEALAQRGMLSMQAPSEVQLVHRTVKNMVQAGELRKVGDARVAGKRRKLGLYAATAGGWDAGASTRSDGSALQAAWGMAA